MEKKKKYRIKLRITPLALAAILAVSFAACKTITATEAAGTAETAETEALSEKSDSTEETQVIELTAQQSSDELPSDEDVAIGSDELPTDDAPTGNIAWPLEMYETDSEAPATYNGVTEGETIEGVITYYDICYACCGKTDGITASGLAVHNGMENPHIVSLNWLPLGSIVEINGTQYTVADRGGYSLNAVGRADIFVPEGHQKALALGRTETTITIIEIAED